VGVFGIVCADLALLRAVFGHDLPRVSGTCAIVEPVVVPAVALLLDRATGCAFHGSALEGRALPPHGAGTAGLATPVVTALLVGAVGYTERFVNASELPAPWIPPADLPGFLGAVDLDQFVLAP